MAYLPGVQDNSGQILGAAIQGAGQDIGSFLKARKEEQKKIESDAKGYEALYKYAEKSNPELLSMLDPDGRGIQGMSKKDMAAGLLAGLQTLKVGQTIQQVQAEAMRAKAQMTDAQRMLDAANNSRGDMVFSPLLGKNVSPSEATAAGNAFAQMTSRGGLTPEQAVLNLGGDPMFLQPGTRMIGGGYQTTNIPEGVLGAIQSTQPQTPTVSPEAQQAVIQYLSQQATPASNATSNVMSAFGNAGSNISKSISDFGPLGVLAAPGRMLADRATDFQRYRATDAVGEKQRAASQTKKMSSEQLNALAEELSRLGISKATAKQAAAQINKKELDKANTGPKNGVDTRTVASIPSYSISQE